MPKMNVGIKTQSKLVSNEALNKFLLSISHASKSKVDLVADLMESIYKNMGHTVSKDEPDQANTLVFKQTI